MLSLQMQFFKRIRNGIAKSSMMMSYPLRWCILCAVQVTFTVKKRTQLFITIGPEFVHSIYNDKRVAFQMIRRQSLHINIVLHIFESSSLLKIRNYNDFGVCACFSFLRYNIRDSTCGLKRHSSLSSLLAHGKSAHAYLCIRSSETYTT